MTMSQQKGNQVEKSITAISAIVALSTLLAGCGQGSKSDSSLSDSTALVLCKSEAKSRHRTDSNRHFQIPISRGQAALSA